MEWHAVAGIDIGGEKKGHHLVILRGIDILCNTTSRNPDELLRYCKEHQVIAVGIDAPCQWSSGLAARTAEKELARRGISCFATPVRDRALASVSGFYDWMLNGERVYEAFIEHYSLFAGIESPQARICFETFPHAITCALLGREIASAKHKRVQRRLLLENAGVNTQSLKTIDDIDAALCALSANYLLDGNADVFGDQESGFIVVPATGERR